MASIELSIEEMYDGSYEGYEAIVDKSLDPRSPDVLYDKFDALGPTRESLVLDVGCRNAAHACELHRRFGCRVEGIDLVDSNIRAATSLIEEQGTGEFGSGSPGRYSRNALS